VRRSDRLFPNRSPSTTARFPLIYSYNPNARTLTRKARPGENLVDSVRRFALRHIPRTASAGTYDQYPVAAVANCKVSTVKGCSRTILGAKVNSRMSRRQKSSSANIRIMILRPPQSTLQGSVLIGTICINHDHRAGADELPTLAPTRTN